ncbi:MAG TPA: heavy-metal-associated domain-containing protein [Bacteroidia bacterium]|jgi:copper chaperone CopZ|nr:heavy-metal-associated domain-containing protein [Bacteroidia bacterium]
MKKFLRSLFILTALVILSACGNKTTSKETVTTSAPAIATSQFKVWGNCEQCKETIESSLKSDGIVKADWNEKTKLMRITYDEHKISLDQIQKNIAAVGYDNAGYKGDDKAYANLPECCQYERK